MKLLCIDRYTNKNIALQSDTDEYTPWTLIKFRNTNDNKLSIGKYLWFYADERFERLWNARWTLQKQEKEYFDKKDKDAKALFPKFKKRFKEIITETNPVTASKNIIFSFMVNKDIILQIL